MVSYCLRAFVVKKVQVRLVTSCFDIVIYPLEGCDHVFIFPALFWSDYDKVAFVNISKEKIIHAGI